VADGPPPWARPARAADGPEPDASASSAGPGTPPASDPPAPHPLPEGGDQSLFPDRASSGEAYLFPGPGRRRQVGGDLPAGSRTGRRVGPAVDPPVAPGADRGDRGERVGQTAGPGAGPPPGRRPPPVPVATDDPAPTGISIAAGRGPFVGVVAGPVTVTTARHRFWGLRALTGAAVVAACATAGRALTSGVTGPVLVAGLLAPALLVALVGAAQRFAARGRSGAHPATAAKPAPDPVVTIRRFRVQPVTGDARSYVLTGELPDASLRTGDIVRVAGRRVRDGHIAVREVEQLATLDGPVVRCLAGRPAPSYLAARWTDRLGLGLAALTLLGAAAVLTGIAA
jgi:hypothetical protein